MNDKLRCENYFTILHWELAAGQSDLSNRVCWVNDWATTLLEDYEIKRGLRKEGWETTSITSKSRSKQH